jgi:phenylacetate-CoA ligase
MDDPTRSAFAEEAWPALPTPQGAGLLAMQYQFERTERWPAGRLLAAQRRQAESVLRHALETVPYYRSRRELYRAGPNGLDEDSWAKLPILSRRDIQSAGNALLSDALPKHQGKTHTLSTSGSTGAPVTIHGTELTQFYWSAFTLRQYLWHGLDFTKVIASIRFGQKDKGKYPEGSVAPGWGPAIAAAYLTGPAHYLSIATPIADQMEWLGRIRPEYLITYPTNLSALLIYCRSRRIEFPVKGGVLTLSEILPPETRELCREVAGLTIIDMYSSQEVGYLALQCPKHEHYHVQSENVLVEVLDADGNPCRPGETGSVVVTALHNFAMPLIRYAIGDYAVQGEPCDCGRSLPVLKRIMGRARNMLTLPDGTQIWPYFGGDKLPELAPIRQYQLAQVGRTQLELRLVVDRPLIAQELERLRDSINRAIGTPFEISFSFRDTIPRSAGGKFEDFRSELPS